MMVLMATRRPPTGDVSVGAQSLKDDWFSQVGSAGRISEEVLGAMSDGGSRVWRISNLMFSASPAYFFAR